MKALGRHLLVEYFDCDKNILNDVSRIEEAMTEAAVQSGATIVRSVFHLFNPHGVSGVVVIAESHLAIHTWPEYGYAAVDYFTCGQAVDPYKADEVLRRELGCLKATVTELNRGIPSATDEVIDHKTEFTATVPDALTG